MKSLRRRLLLTVSSTTLVLWGLASAISYYKALDEATELMDGQLAQTARLLMAQIDHEKHWKEEVGSHTEVVGDSITHPYEQPLEFQVWSPAGTLLLRSDDAPEIPMANRLGYMDFHHEGRIWRMLSLRSPDGRYQVEISQPAGKRKQVAFEVATQVALPMGLALPLLAAVVYVSVRRGLRPLNSLAHGVAARSPDNLDPIPDPNTPNEVRPLVEAINRLIRRLRVTLENERRFTADAAHELRTPLAALKVQAEVALLTKDEADREHALRQVVAGVERANRLTSQLLELARLDPQAGLTTKQPVALADVMGHAYDQVAHKAEAAGVELLVVAGPKESIMGDPAMLVALLRNLLENAVRHSSSGTSVEMGVTRTAAGLRLWVKDAGTGIPAEELPRVLRRFHRGSHARGEGSGLGLAIVGRIAELHGAELSLANRPEGGVLAELIWPADSLLV